MGCNNEYLQHVKEWYCSFAHLWNDEQNLFPNLGSDEDVTLSMALLENHIVL